MADINEDFATYGLENEPESPSGIHWFNLILYQNEIIKRHNAEINELKDIIRILHDKFEAYKNLNKVENKLDDNVVIDEKVDEKVDEPKKSSKKTKNKKSKTPKKVTNLDIVKNIIKSFENENITMRMIKDKLFEMGMNIDKDELKNIINKLQE